MKKIIIFFIAALLLFSGCGAESQKNDEPNVGDVSYELSDEPTDFVLIKMKDGSKILIELYPEIAPETVANFKKLVSEKFYDGIIFHRVVPGFVIQGGDPDGTGRGGSSETIKGEFEKNGFDNKLKHERGVISMARLGDPYYDSATSQFFICLSSSYRSSLDGGYAAFGEVIAGMDTVDAIAAVKTDSNDKPTVPQVMESVRFVKIVDGE